MRAGALAAALSVLVVLTGCTGAPDPKHTHTSSATPSTATATPAPDPTLQPDASAKKNLPYFDFVNKKTLAANPNPVGRSFIDGLVAAGFQKKDMLVTADKTTINLTPGSIQFSVFFNGSCLIGQYGGDGLGYHSEVTAVLSTGRCLIGDTTPIDW